ncbi:hypothetical protein EON65_34245 [archaeon]|nr:MAG: hypothetical protein EON65_34245 [archaeon]
MHLKAVFGKNDDLQHTLRASKGAILNRQNQNQIVPLPLHKGIMEEVPKVESPVKDSMEGATPGKRQRKQVDFFAATIEVTQKKDHSITASGSGTKLAQYEYFLQELTKVKGDSEVVKCLHTLMYNTPGRKTSAKHNLREFNGFGSDVNVKEKTEKVVENKKKWTVSLLKEALSLFGMERGGNREELCERLVEYLAHPRIVVAPGKTKRRRSTSKSPKKQSKKSKGEKVKRAPTAYILFSNAHRAEVKEQNPDISFTDVGKTLGEKWNALSPEEKEVK